MTRVADGPEGAAAERGEPQYVSPHFTREKISPGVFAGWVDVWEDRVWGWWLVHVDAQRGQRDAGFVMLLVAVIIIETMQVFYEGEDSDRASARFFRAGFLRLFKSQSGDRIRPENVANAVYKAEAV